MIEVSVRRVKPGQEETVRSWLRQVGGSRRGEAAATLMEEGVTHETVVLFETSDGPMVIYAIEADDLDEAYDVASTSRHRIDADHKRIMESALGEPVPIELLLDLRPDGRPTHGS
jgi:Family of unknown function (DUF6176)